VLALHHGFDAEAFAADTTPLPAHAINEIERADDALRLLFVSHYNYYRNFETLFRAIPILSKRINKKVKLFLTCRLKSEENPGIYRTESAASLADDLSGSESIVELGTIPYRSLHHLYRACHLYVSPAYAESFAHPLIEAMSSGLPVVASDLPVHREICGDAGLYFSRLSPDDLAEQVTHLHKSPELAETLSRSGLRRASEFSWREHVDRLLGLARKLVQSESERN
jgi:glycosyltransferase involved in cell wall biosynthesis